MKNLATFLLLLLTATLHAEDVATITIRKGDTTNVALKSLDGGDGAAAGKVLQNDLELSGLFNVTTPERATFSISGSAADGSLKGLVTDQRGSVILQKTYQGGVRTAAHHFADDIVGTLTGQKGIASTKIAFISTRTGRKEVYTADYDGANVKQLTSDGTISVAPSLSSDGSQLAYTGYQSGYADIYLIDLASGARHRIVKFPGTNSGASFAPDGRRIACAVSKDGNPELYVIGTNGRGGRRLTRTNGVESSPTWSPDGSEIIYSSDERGGPQLFKIGADGGSGRLISTGFGYSTEPNWSPDGRKVAFTVRDGGLFIAVKDLNGGTTRKLAEGEDPVWGADSRHVIFSNGSSIVLLDTQTGHRTPIITGMNEVTEPTWSR